MTLDHETLEFDMMSKVKTDGTTQELAARKMGIAPIVFRNVRNFSDIKISTYLKIVEWLGKQPNDYII